MKYYKELKKQRTKTTKMAKLKIGPGAWTQSSLKKEKKKRPKRYVKKIFIVPSN